MGDFPWLSSYKPKTVYMDRGAVYRHSAGLLLVGNGLYLMLSNACL